MPSIILFVGFEISPLICVVIHNDEKPKEVFIDNTFIVMQNARL